MSTSSFDPLTAIHYYEVDPGVTWDKDQQAAIEVNQAVATSGALTPNVVALQGGGYRMYYTGFAPGISQKHHSGHILSASSKDGLSWHKEYGVRIDIHSPKASRRTLCPEVVPNPEGGFRMYYEARGSNTPTVILSAISTDGLTWDLEDGIRVGDDQWSYGTPRCLYFPTSQGLLYRLYFHHYSFPLSAGLGAQNHIISATSYDGINFDIEPGVRISQQTERETMAVYAPEVIRLKNDTFRMYYSAWTEEIHGGIFTAISENGLDWNKWHEPVLDLESGWDAGMASEPCVAQLCCRSV